MNFTNSPFETLMKEAPRPGNGGAEPCSGCRERHVCGGHPKRCKKKYRSLIPAPPAASGQVGPRLP